MVLRADPVLVAVLGALALSACASAGRTAAWERPPAPPSGTTTSSTSSTAVTRLEAQAQAHWARRDEPAEVREAIRAWEALLAEDAASVEARVMSSRAHYYLADALLAPEGAPPEEELEAYRRGVEHGEQALLRMAPDFEARMRAGEHFEDAVEAIGVEAVPAAYWYGLNLSRFANKLGMDARMYYRDRLLALMRRLAVVQPGYFHGGPDRYLGCFYATTPALAGKDLQRSAEAFERARALGQGALSTSVDEARCLCPERADRERFSDLLEAVLAADPEAAPDVAPENRAAQRAARRMLERGPRF
ncbi:MAG: hypothetical protein H6730_24540 [Deltaproteobacteria bacterium]|nr:hypothetical protein [Deltaproteobacteria bacterium]